MGLASETHQHISMLEGYLYLAVNVIRSALLMPTANAVSMPTANAVLMPTANAVPMPTANAVLMLKLM